MTAVKLSTIRGRIKTAIEAIAGEGLKESPLPYYAFGRTPNSIGHKAFSIGFLGTVAGENRQKPNVGALTQTQLDISVCYRLRPLSQTADFDNALDLENKIIIALCDRTNATLYQNTHIKFTTLNRSLVETGEYILSSIGFEILHHLPLN